MISLFFFFFVAHAALYILNLTFCSHAKIQVKGYTAFRGNADLKLPAVVLENSLVALKSAPH